MRKKELKIAQEDLKKIYGKDWKFFQEKILSNCYCHTCKGSYNATIVDYKIFINDLNDTILKGKCKICSTSVNRYLETGEVYAYEERIEEVKKDGEKK